jgi:hypothetical protein
MCITSNAKAYTVVTPTIVNGLANEKMPKTIATILNILKPFFVNLSNRKNTILAISVGSVLEIMMATKFNG